ncbi:MAG TPA: nicotinate-nucleotide adenylyltransferase [Mobilitalea sp.]|nr:nicotinate-nucleotide adenylyltransferase [Mobilitalea sp.]
MKKVGIMGGTFNPIHFGHLFLAENAYEQLGLDKILFMPSKNPPHKQKPEEVTQKQRVDMLQLAIQDNPHFELSTLELDREGMTYTADTLTLLTSQNLDTQYYFIVGADSLLYMQDWKDPQRIFDHCIVVAACRDQVDKKQLYQQAELLEKTFHANITMIEMPVIQIASRVIRERLEKKQSVRYHIPDAVNEYIMKNGLYQSIPEDNK